MPARRRSNWGRRLFALTLLAAATAAVVFVGLSWDELTGREPQLREIAGGLEDTFNDLRDLIRDNTR